MAAKDFLGCIQSNSGQSPGVSGPTKDSASNLGREKCFDTGVCIAQPGQDQLGLAKVVGWLYRYNAANNTVNYWNPEAKRVPHKGQPARYVAATPGYCREISPAKITCTPPYSGGHWVAGTPGTAGGPRKYSYVEVIDCQDLTHAAYRQGRLRGNWSKYVGDEAQFARNKCSDQANFKVKTMKL